MTRFFLFLLSYGLLVISTSQLIIYLNYRTIGYDWSAVFHFIIRTPDFAILIASSLTLMVIVFFRGPLRSPFS